MCEARRESRNLRFESLVSFEGWKPVRLQRWQHGAFESLVSFEGWKPKTVKGDT